MNPLLKVLGLMLIVSVVLTGPVCAEDDESDREVIKPEAERRRPATAVDFGYELGLPFESLSTLGSQIEKCREKADPVGLAAAANLLKVSERVSGKKATLTAAELEEEAVELAKLRSVPNELEALASLTGNDKLSDLAEAAKARDAEQQAAAKAGETSKDLHGDLHVINHSHEGFAIYANGHYLGYVHPHGQREWHLHGIHYIDARNHYHRLHRHIHGRRHHYDFYIHLDH